MTKFFIPAEILEKMVCLSCKHYLSIFPINTKNDSSGAICGRCQVPDKMDFIRDEAYEGIAQYLLFPCMHSANGCEESLVPVKLGDHEKCCKFRKFNCPSSIYSRCPWQGPQSELIAHYQKLHPDLLLNDTELKFNFLTSHEGNMLLLKHDQMFIVKKEVDSRQKLFTCSVLHLRTDEEDEIYNYFLKVESEDKNYFHRCPEKSTKEEDCTKLEAELLKNELNGPDTIIVNIEIVKPSSLQLEVLDMAKDSEVIKNPKVSWDLLSDLECPMCFNYMRPPIFQCLNGHSICKQCKVRYMECPVCRGSMADTQNYTLERLTHHLTYPCKNHKSGCTFSGKWVDIEEHEIGCYFGPYDCPMKHSAGCEWNSKKSDILEHIDSEHADIILQSEKVDVLFSKDDANEKLYFVKFSKKCFKLLYKYANEKFYWEVQFIGHSNLSKNYRFEVDVLDLSGNKRRCYLMGLVSPLADQSRSFQDPQRYVVASFEQVNVCILNGLLSFRFRIIKDDALL